MHNSCITQMLQMVDGFLLLLLLLLLLLSFLSYFLFLLLVCATRELQVKCFMIIKCRRQLS